MSERQPFDVSGELTPEQQAAMAAANPGTEFDPQTEPGPEKWQNPSEIDTPFDFGQEPSGDVPRPWTNNSAETELTPQEPVNKSRLRAFGRGVFGVGRGVISSTRSSESVPVPYPKTPQPGDPFYFGDKK